ncbi:winged helix-turn-helix transcriptional regulator [Bacillus wiedmannii]|uniref:winged helix-turn-helix transcriptional regulator n=1 Tax=Bacillus wiedmannii TaxID=1890302 RepID=UPI000BFC48EE|nr:winged helix-turn-helix domain-containing protein [Bacillus wiedmannii]PHF10874.1 winged helix-turn-helix domain-containing protein [Bacillus wiedmannii]
MNNWNTFIEWRNEQGLKGLATEDEYNEYLSQVGEQPESDKLKGKELQELESDFAGLGVKTSVQATFDAIRELIVLGSTITYDDLAHLTGNSLATIKRHVAELEEKGFLHIKRGQHTNTYYYGVDMKKDAKKAIKLVDEFTWIGSTEDIAGEVTFVDGTTELHVAIWNIEEVLARTASFYWDINEVDSVYRI